MNYTEFVDAMLKKAREQMEPEVRVSTHTAVKNNGTVRTGLVLMTPGINMSPTIYLEEFYEQYLRGVRITDLVIMIQSLYRKIKVNQSYPYEEILSYRKVREKIVYKVVQKEANAELLRQVPHEEYLNLAVLFYVMLEQTGFGTASLLIRNEHLKMWDVTAAEIAETAHRNTPELLPMEMERMAEYLYVITNRTRSLGAAVLLYPGIWRQVREEIGENFYILPSSIHELILVPESCGVDQSHLAMMVQEINRTEVEDEEILADTVYYYCAEEDRVLL